MSEAIIFREVCKTFESFSAPFNRKMSPASGKTVSHQKPEIHKSMVSAVNQVSFSVQAGEVFAILGPSAAGKTTLIRLLATQLMPDSGEIRIFGLDPTRQPLQIQRLINRISVEASFFKRLSVLENLLYGARLYGLSGSDTRQLAIELLARFGLEGEVIHQAMETISRSKQQKVAIARALLSRPRLLLLDEPTTGLDLWSRMEVEAVIRELRQDYGTTVIITTQDRLQAEDLSDRVAVINRGRLVALVTPQGLSNGIEYDAQQEILKDVFTQLAHRKVALEEAV